MKRSKTSKAWMQEHVNDFYVKQAQQDGYRSRAAYKLLEIAARDRLFYQGMRVVDLGAAPGGWSQVVTGQLSGNGQIVALDLLPMATIPHVQFIQGDFQDAEILAKLENLLAGKKIQLVLSDMAPNMSGMDSVDQPRSLYLAELAAEFALDWLEPNGVFLVKVFQGEGFQAYLQQLRQYFVSVSARKPKASRDRSREVYLLCRGLKA